MKSTASYRESVPMKQDRHILENEIQNLTQGVIDTEYTIKAIKTDEQDMKDFLFTLGCYQGESITIISHLSDNYVVSIKDARYSIDAELAEAIIV